MTKRFCIAVGSNGWPFLVSLMGRESFYSSRLRNSYKNPSGQSQVYSQWRDLGFQISYVIHRDLDIFRLIDLLRSFN